MLVLTDEREKIRIEVYTVLANLGYTSKGHDFVQELIMSRDKCGSIKNNSEVPDEI